MSLPVSTFGTTSGCSKSGSTGTSPSDSPSTVRVPRIEGWNEQ